MIKKVCVGLDLPINSSLEDYISIINEVGSTSYKVNPAFVSPHVMPLLASELNIRGLFWIYDGKLGDVPHTNERYADYVFNQLGANAVTLNPFVGLEALEPFFQYEDRYSFVLCKTTNSGDKKAQSAMYTDILSLASERSNVGIVYSSLDSEGLRTVSEGNFLILAPGVGSQGGSAAVDEPNVLYTVSRTVINSPNPRETYLEIRGGVEAILLEGLRSRGFIKEGEFTLSSGLSSNYYIDLRCLSSDINFYQEVCLLLSRQIKTPDILGVESGSISLASTLACLLNKPFGFVRKTAKSHGTSRVVEGISEGNATIVDDVLTTGSSLIKAVLDSRSSGIYVSEVLVVIERVGYGGREALESYGVKVNSLARL